MKNSQIRFSKYQGCGNDFILLNGIDIEWRRILDEEDIALLCHRRFGIGADGLMIVEEASKDNFNLLYYNADGKLGSFCGNGSRCSVLFAKEILNIPTKGTFLAYDGAHEYIIHGEDDIEIQMLDVSNIKELDGDFVLDTGSPHYVKWVKDLAAYDVGNAGKKIRNSEKFALEGINVNFCEIENEHISIRTFERGVEAETLACGTGVTASAISANILLNWKSPIIVHALGGIMSVSFEAKEKRIYANIRLRGPARKVFSGLYQAP